MAHERFDYLEISRFPERFEIPEEYHLDQDSLHLYRLGSYVDQMGGRKLEPMLSTPIYIEKQWVDLETHQIYLSLVFYQQGRWKSMVGDGTENYKFWNCGLKPL